MDTNLTSTDPSVEATQLTDQMWREVLGQVRAFVGRRMADPERAEDLVGEILLRIHQNLGSVDDRERLTHWVLRVARNAVIDEYRRAGRSRELLVPTPADMAIVEPVPGVDDAPGVLDELAGCLRPLLGGLPPEQRRAVQMIDLDGLPQASAARREGVSLSGVKSRVQRGQRRLAELLGQCCALTLDGRGLPMDHAPMVDADRRAAAAATDGGDRPPGGGSPHAPGDQLQQVPAAVCWTAQFTAHSDVGSPVVLAGLSSVTA